jgi:hypothetical protein
MSDAQPTGGVTDELPPRLVGRLPRFNQNGRMR